MLCAMIAQIDNIYESYWGCSHNNSMLRTIGSTIFL